MEVYQMTEYLYKNQDVNWKTTCYNRAWLGHLDIMHDLAKKLAYPFFAWNGRIYLTETGEDTSITTDKLN